MKVLRVMANNRKRELVLETKGGKYVFPFSQLALRPSTADPLVEVFVDTEAGSEAITYRLRSGKEDTVLLDNVLWYNQDPEIMRKLFLHDLTVRAQDAIKTKHIGKRFLIRKLKTSPTHLYRLLDQTNYGKTIDQMLKLLAAVGVRVEIKMKNAA